MISEKELKVLWQHRLTFEQRFYLSNTADLKGDLAYNNFDRLSPLQRQLLLKAINKQQYQTSQASPPAIQGELFPADDVN